MYKAYLRGEQAVGRWYHGIPTPDAAPTYADIYN